MPTLQPTILENENPLEGPVDAVIPTTEHDEINLDMLDTPKIKATSQVPTRLQHMLSGNWSLGENTRGLKANNSLAKKATSEEALEKILEDPDVDDIEKADNKCLHKLNVPRFRLVPMVRELAKIYPLCSISMSGFFLYPADGGYMGWHTNSDAPYTRVYITHALEGDKSFFRYRIDGECVTSWDKAGWVMRQFEVNDDAKDKFWHTVYADTKRLSVGFRINRNLK